MKKTKRLGTILIMATFALCFLTGCGSKRVNVNDYVTVNFSGSDGFGQADRTFDKKRFIEDVCSYVKNDTEKFKIKKLFGVDGYKEKDYELGTCPSILEGYWADENSNLYNGDHITWIWQFDNEMLKEEYGITLVSEDLTVKVDGLEEIQTLDIFKDLKYIFHGKDGEAKLTEIRSEKYPNLMFSSDKDSEISVGDKLHISLTSEEEYCITEYAVIPEYLETDYEVKELDYALTSLSQIDETAHKNLLKLIEDVKDGDGGGEQDLIDDNSIEYVGRYFMEHPAYPENETLLLYVYQYNVNDNVEVSGQHDPNAPLYGFVGVINPTIRIYEETFEKNDLHGSSMTEKDNCITNIDEYFGIVGGFNLDPHLGIFSDKLRTAFDDITVFEKNMAECEYTIIEKELQ